MEYLIMDENRENNFIKITLILMHLRTETVADIIAFYT